MDDSNQFKGSFNGAAQTSEHNPDDLRIIEHLRCEVKNLTARLENTETELERQHNEKMCVMAYQRELKKELESLKGSAEQYV